MEPKVANRVEAQLATLVANQHGVVSTQQLLRLGLGIGAIKHRACTGRLYRVHRGVYSVGHAGLSHEGRWMAAVLACGEGAVLSHRAAAALWSLLPPPSGFVDVTIPGDPGRARRRGIRLHRSRLLLPSPGFRAPTTRRSNIPVTTPARTLADLRACVSPTLLAKAHRQAEVLGVPLDEAPPPRERTHSELERLFLRLCRRHRLPEPEVNARVGPYLPDFLWPGARLIAEADGYAFHRGRANFEHDRRRAADLAASGYEVLRFTWQQVEEEPASVVSAVRTRLAAREAPTPASARPA